MVDPRATMPEKVSSQLKDEFNEYIQKKNWKALYKWHKQVTPWIKHETILTYIEEYKREVAELEGPKKEEGEQKQNLEDPKEEEQKELKTFSKFTNDTIINEDDSDDEIFQIEGECDQKTKDKVNDYNNNQYTAQLELRKKKKDVLWKRLTSIESARIKECQKKGVTVRQNLQKEDKLQITKCLAHQVVQKSKEGDKDGYSGNLLEVLEFISDILHSVRDVFDIFDMDFDF